MNIYTTDELDEHFANFLIDLVENVSEDVIGEDGIDAFVGTILSFNQHFVGKCKEFRFIRKVHCRWMSDYLWLLPITAGS